MSPTTLICLVTLIVAVWGGVPSPAAGQVRIQSPTTGKEGLPPVQPTQPTPQQGPVNPQPPQPVQPVQPWQVEAEKFETPGQTQAGAPLQSQRATAPVLEQWKQRQQQQWEWKQQRYGLDPSNIDRTPSRVYK